MSELQRQVTIITSLGKRYSGCIDVPNSALRTTDLFNSSSTFWKNQQQARYFKDSLLLHEARLMLSDGALYESYDNLQLRLSAVIIFYDEFATLGRDDERTRAENIQAKTGEQNSNVKIIANTMGSSYFEISGAVSGAVQKKSHDRFLPLQKAAIVEIIKKENKWFKKSFNLKSNFIGVNTSYIEAVDVTVSS